MSRTGITFKQFPRDALPAKIVDSILEMIREGQLSPGDKLPPERDLASMMKVGRPALREALRGLALMNVVEIRHGQGTYVTSLEANLLTEHLDLVFSLDDHTFLDLLDARKVLEVGLVMLAAERITDEKLTSPGRARR
jgi:GntR family transcriptional regulator, transcriptional repressor for pyruvate dehydrogenase complex